MVLVMALVVHGSRKLKLPASHPSLEGNCLPFFFSKIFLLYLYTFNKTPDCLQANDPASLQDNNQTACSLIKLNFFCLYLLIFKTACGQANCLRARLAGFVEPGGSGGGRGHLAGPVVDELEEHRGGAGRHLEDTPPGSHN